MANRQRGEISAELDGRKWTLCLTLGALAELETHFGVDDLAALAARLGSGKLAAADLLAIIAAGLKGGGHTLEIAEIAEMRAVMGVTGFARIVADLLAVTFGGNDADAAETVARP